MNSFIMGSICLATILYSWYVIMSLPLQYDAIMKGITCVLIEGVCWSTVYSLGDAWNWHILHVFLWYHFDLNFSFDACHLSKET